MHCDVNQYILRFWLLRFQLSVFYTSETLKSKTGSPFGVEDDGIRTKSKKTALKADIIDSLLGCCI